jgi:hypothetical protein
MAILGNLVFVLDTSFTNDGGFDCGACSVLLFEFGVGSVEGAGSAARETF